MTLLTALVATFLMLLSLAALVYPFRPFKTRKRALLVFGLAFLSVPFIALLSDTKTARKQGLPSKNTSFKHAINDEPTNRVAQEIPITSQFVWVTADRLNRRTCPSTNCGIVGTLVFREGTHIYGHDGDWARVSKYYDASCVAGKSEYVDKGNNACSLENGIENGRLAEWVSAFYLADVRPPDPSALAKGRERIIAHSDDFARYRLAFLAAADRLIEARRCTESDFIENGGWVRSPKYRDKPIYFVFCGGLTVANRLYLDVRSGRVFR